MTTTSDSETSDPPTDHQTPHPSGELMTWRALQLQCPRCGEGRLYRSFFRMEKRCQNCRLRFDRGPGYYLGAVYVNYGITSLLVTAAFVAGRFWLRIPSSQLLGPLLAFCLLFPLLIFRHARAIWLSMDCRLDPAVLNETEDSPLES
ncbi:DUF983 domain-containing protein [Planctomicrobium piriforme]|uniref:Uncharacterized conserved protein, DUF983 family n=1 Tax=Planctomicrobium piriforme TaxID=1576369 RepID=A0A1I3DML6_9PLAN|nr:DUF983 domain-containing protein [Planctomicrobium piriforme]SFH87913.1 Uncharacterized conserved protein, DUF983 family [Planctomicrobium piriforme]